MAASLYRKYRPGHFSELVGQEHVAKALQNALSQNRLAHAYLFSGTRGTGKTSTARILGQVLNCERFIDGFPDNAVEVEPCGECDACKSAKAGNSFDVIELDAASNNGVDDMRDLIEKVSYSSAAGGTKVYIIDEVHELTGRASNALLKTLEEPPEHVVFILATTNPEKVLPTIRSRTQHFEFVSLNESQLINHVEEILSKENKELDRETIEHVARKGAGSVRDTLSFLDQVLALGVNTFEEFEQTHSTVETSKILELVVSTSSGDIGASIGALHEISSQGKEPRAIIENIISVARDCLVVSLNPDTSILLSGHNDKDELKNVGDKCGTNFLRNFILQLGKAVADMRGTASLNPLLNVEIALLSSMPQSGYSSNSGLDNLGSISSDPVSKVSVPPVSTEKKIEQKPPFFSEEKKVEPQQNKSPFPAAIAKENEQPAQSFASKQPAAKATLGALKSGAAPAVDPKSAPAPAARKVSIFDIEETWPKVLSLLSGASQEALRQMSPQKIQGDVLFFQAPQDQLEDIKARFKKDASIIRGFLESMLETTFKFQLVALDVKEESKKEEKILEESQEYDAVNHIVEVFGGEVVE